MNVKEKRKNSPFLFSAIAVFFVVLYFNTGIVDPFNSAKLYSILLFSAWILGYLANELYIHFRNKIKIKKSNIYLYLLLFFVLFQFFALLNTESFFTGFFGEYMRKNGFLTYFCLVIISATVYLSIRLENLETIFKTFLFVLIPETIYGTLQHFGQDFVNWNNQYNPIIGTLGNPNFSAATYAVLAVLIGTYTHKSNYSRILKVLIYSLTSFVVLIIFWTNAKQGLIALFFGYATYLLLYLYVTRNKLAAPVFLIFLIASLLIVLGMLQSGPLKTFLYKDSVSLRGYYWRAGIQMFRDNLIFGVGLDSYGDFFKQYRERQYPYTRGFDITSTNAHNTFIQHFATGGIFVGSLYVLILAIVIFKIFKFMKTIRSEFSVKESNHYTFQIISLFSALIAFHAQSFVSIDNLGIGILGWFLTASILGCLEIIRKSEVLDTFRTGANIKTEKKSLLQIVVSILAFIPALFLVTQLYEAETSFVKVNNLKTDSNSDLNLYKSQINNVLNKKLLEPALQVALAYKFANSGLPNDARNLLDKILISNPRNPDALRLSSQLSETSRDFSSAIKTREWIKKVDPWNLNNLYNLGVDYSSTGNTAKAIENFQFVANSGTQWPEVKASADSMNKIKTK